ncbi:histidine kinase [Gammaproteobacteria bacterium]
MIDGNGLGHFDGYNLALVFSVGFSLMFSAAMLTYLNETAPVLMLGLNTQARVTSANAHARRVLGDPLVGRALRELVVDFTPVPDLTAPDVTSESGHLLSFSTAAGLPDSFRFRFFALPDGWLALGSLNFEEQARLGTEVLALNHELNDLTRQLHQANAELRELNQLKNRFLGMAAHDLRNPIGLIMNFSELILDEAGAQLSEEHQEFLRICLAAAINMQRLVESFLDVSIIESGELRLDLRLASVREILAGVEPIARLVAGKKNITLCGDSGDDARRLPVDVSKVQQVLVNLVGNAVEHSVSGQRVWLSSHWDDQQIVFVVRDEGPGIAPEDQVRLFTAFAHAGTRKTAGERSVGLGLAIARLVVKAHGGRLWVESIPGQGATFRVALPIQAASHTQETTPP